MVETAGANYAVRFAKMLFNESIGKKVCDEFYETRIFMILRE